MQRTLATLAALLIAPSAAHAGAELVGQVPDATRAVSINFVDYGGRDVMFVSTLDGLRSYDLADPVRSTT